MAYNFAMKFVGRLFTTDTEAESFGILVFGDEGTGKSNLINRLLEEDVAAVELSRHNRSPLFPVRPDRICRKYSVPRTIYFRNIRSASEIFGPPRSPTDERPRI